jgi:hypothetical protein
MPWQTTESVLSRRRRETKKVARDLIWDACSQALRVHRHRLQTSAYRVTSFARPSLVNHHLRIPDTLYVLVLSRCGLGMLLRLFCLTLLVNLPWSLANPLSLQDIQQGAAIHLPLSRREVSTSIPRRVSEQGAIGLGDYIDVWVLKSTTVIISSWNQDIQRTSSSRRDVFTSRSRYGPRFGDVAHPLTLLPDTGSSDLWVLSSSCAADCFSATVPLYPKTSFQPSGLAIRLEYGDSMTGTFAQGSIGKDLASIAGFQLQDQYLAAISETNTSVLQRGSSGIFGLGFPVNRCVSNSLCWPSVFRDYVIRVLGPISYFESF